ncbi:MAG: hypothetical protein ACOYK6_08630 [Chthoniobacterales bacterium]
MKISPSLQSHLEKAEAAHLVTHVRQNSKNQIRKIVTMDPVIMETTRKARILQSFANKKIAAILRADLEKNYGLDVASLIFNDEEYQRVMSEGLTVLKGREIYKATASFQLITRSPLLS